MSVSSGVCTVFKRSVSRRASAANAPSKLFRTLGLQCVHSAVSTCLSSMSGLKSLHQCKCYTALLAVCLRLLHGQEHDRQGYGVVEGD